MPSNSPERHLVASENHNIASRQASQDSDHEVKYQTGLMPAEYTGLEVASPSPSPGMQYYQPAPGAAPAATAPGGYAPYHDQHNGLGYESHQQYPAHSAAGTAYGASQTGIPPKKNKRIWGIPAATFCVAVVALVFFLGTIGASAAAGTIAQTHAAYVQTCEAKLEKSSSPSACATSGSPAASASASASGTAALSASAAATASSSSASSTPTSFTSIPLPGQASSILGEATTNCPDLSSENKTYTVPGSNLRFVRECGNNYPTNDLGHIPLTRMEDCMNLCAALAVTTQSTDGPCIGVAWVTAGKQGTDENYCWLKSAKGAPDPKANIEAAWLERT
ncbi:hypothetical protein CORC01_13913 [Colletotrichum orchidophilum]|uniref:Apple domain-containing protein n=1 Tax=Colletotrichum orchidophilum TaxID=1209926 RepID=A0A1G4ANZ5_9PEZI|nr:uncharacterized protein CORC01_13913 [Colletotrichum orchidophilum]OHE90773.1 hypothetical protein CORC01_13913 [Colletotrichum orchidophilum]